MMPKKHPPIGTPEPWTSLARRRWAEAHTFEIHYRLSPKSTFLAVPAGQIVVPELVDDDDEEETEEEETEEEDEPEREGIEGAADTASELWRRAWSHFDSLDRKRAFYQLTAYKLEDGNLVPLEKTTTGGTLKDDGTIDIDSAWDEASDRERERSIQDWAMGVAKDSVKMMLSIADSNRRFAIGVTDLVTETLKARAEVATKHLEHREAELEAEISMERAKQAGDVARDWGDRFAPAVNLFAAAKHAEATRAPGADRPAHPSPVVESARRLLAALDGLALSYLIPIVGAELASDVLTVLRLSEEADPDPAAIAHAWQAVVPALLKHQPKVAEALPPELAQRLAAALQALTLACASAAA